MAGFKNILVTGASKGIGYSVAEYFLEHASSPLNIIMIARNSEAFDKAHESLRYRFPQSTIHKVAADLSIPEEVQGIVNYVVENKIQLEVLINNAGYTNPTGFKDISVEDFRYTLEVNLIAPFILMQELFKNGIHLKKIVNVASTAGMGPRPGWLTYAASKAALISISDTLREELSVFGTDVICISPGRCATDLRKRLAPHEDPSTIMQPSGVSAAIHVLLSEVGSYMDSHNIVIRQ